MKEEIKSYNESKSTKDQAICELLATHINTHLPDSENKIWHGHPVWFIPDYAIRLEYVDLQLET
jgi:hypothetical protein